MPTSGPMNGRASMTPLMRGTACRSGSKMRPSMEPILGTIGIDGTWTTILSEEDQARCTGLWDGDLRTRPSIDGHWASTDHEGIEDDVATHQLECESGIGEMDVRRECFIHAYDGSFHQISHRGRFAGQHQDLARSKRAIAKLDGHRLRGGCGAAEAQPFEMEGRFTLMAQRDGFTGALRLRAIVDADSEEAKPRMLAGFDRSVVVESDGSMLPFVFPVSPDPPPVPVTRGVTPPDAPGVGAEAWTQSLVPSPVGIKVVPSWSAAA